MTLALRDTSDTARNRLSGILSITTGMVMFSLTDMSIKFLSGGYALHQIIMIRSLIALTILCGVIMPMQGGWVLMRTRRPLMHLARGVCVVAANLFFFASLAAMQLAEAVAISFVSPLLITVFSVIFLRESVGPRRWAAVAVGMAGVIIMLRPGTEAFRYVALLPLAGAVAYAALNTMTRRMGGTEAAITLSFYIHLTFLVVSGLMGLSVGDGRFAGTGNASADFLLRAWIWPSPGDWLILIVIGLTSAVGSVMVSHAYRTCAIALVAPFEYVGMPIAVFWGATVFGEWPDAVAWAGIFLIVGGGLYMVWRETVNARG
ncbi:DMT family transporter [Albidovulum sp.]|uniref:DMT family transporter n=1 Tax=Albidovulum sp. TaxID=1872424 RepID=UPI001D24C76D|nr:DMT family transporter [Paracoccaceae bacterium]MCB2138450.1 DMT family transporter [Paracoccaceae bacterium]MCP5323091.1 DMT family transporter [Paracoccaceae bacterium]MCP5375887.1 DMT family transporter [Paracoccaceae bacterium]HRV62278.1 DMT family transporter [Albidovulum sp.]